MYIHNYVTKNAMYYVYVFMQRRMKNSHVIITQLRKLVVPPLILPGPKSAEVTPSSSSPFYHALLSKLMISKKISRKARKTGEIYSCNINLNYRRVTMSYCFSLVNQPVFPDLKGTKVLTLGACAPLIDGMGQARRPRPTSHACSAHRLAA